MKSSLKNKRVLITGGLGFIGSNLAIRLVEEGADVELYDALITDMGGNRFNISPIKNNVKVTIADMRDFKKIKKAVKNKDYIFNLAGTLSHVDSMSNPFLDLDINCRAQLFLLEACRKLNQKVKIIFAGTRNQYGRAIYLPVDEKHIQEPIDINGIHSIAAEKYHFLYSQIYGIETVSLRMSNTFGPRHQMQHPKQGVLNWFIKKIIDNQTIELFGDGLQIRDMNYVDDVIDSLILTAANKRTSGEAYNIGGEPLTLKRFVETVIEVAGRGKYKIVDFPENRKSIEVGNYVADTKKIERALGWQPKVKIKDGLKTTMEYYEKYKKYYWS